MNVLKLTNAQPILQYRQLKFLVNPNEKERLEADGYAFMTEKRHSYTYFDLPINSGGFKNLRLISGESGHTLDLRNFDTQHGLWEKKTCRVEDPSSAADMLCLMGFAIAGQFEKVSSTCPIGVLSINFIVVDSVLAFVEFKAPAAEAKQMSRLIRQLGYDPSMSDVGTTLDLMCAAHKGEVQ